MFPGDHLAFCQKWKNEAGKPAGYTLHLHKHNWRFFMDMWGMAVDAGWQKGLERVGLLDLFPDGNPYWCDVNAATRFALQEALGRRRDPAGRQHGVKFGGVAPFPRRVLNWVNLAGVETNVPVTVYTIPSIGRGVTSEKRAKKMSQGGRFVVVPVTGVILPQ